MINKGINYMQNVLSNEFAHRLRIEENITLDVVFIILGSVFVMHMNGK